MISASAPPNASGGDDATEPGGSSFMLLLIRHRIYGIAYLARRQEPIGGSAAGGDIQPARLGGSSALDRDGEASATISPATATSTKARVSPATVTCSALQDPPDVGHHHGG